MHGREILTLQLWHFEQEIVLTIVQTQCPNGWLAHQVIVHQDGVKVLVLLALSDSGRPDYDEKLGKEISKLGIACFAYTPDRLPELVENALKGNDLKKFERTSRTDKEV